MENPVDKQGKPKVYPTTSKKTMRMRKWQRARIFQTLILCPRVREARKKKKFRPPENLKTKDTFLGDFLFDLYKNCLKTLKTKEFH
ncbi:MAG: hypothetical protein LBD67_01285 [Candidatus Accumulibacter sp.]|nr:hypothetical protein [Accumulibacter sp.]